MKKLLLATALFALLAAPAFASLQCTMTCLAENQECDEGPATCALIFEICTDLCNNPPEFQLSQASTEDSSMGAVVSKLFPAEPFFARLEAGEDCIGQDNP
ncbi:MAG: hypothetical protein AAFY88_13765 [Acidobacteriota bacterium]